MCLLLLCNIKMKAGVCTSLLSVSFRGRECVLASSQLESSRRCKTGKSHGKDVYWGSGAQAGRCFQVLTKAVGMSEYGTVVMLFQASSVGS